MDTTYVEVEADDDDDDDDVARVDLDTDDGSAVVLVDALLLVVLHKFSALYKPAHTRKINLRG